MKTQKSTDKLSSQKLHQEFVRLSSLRHKLKNRMLAILPEIYKSEIWKKYSSSIFEYAGKYGDIAKTTVIKRLRLEENLNDLPHLKAAIEKVGVHKVAMIAKIATPKIDKVLAENLLNMSKMAVQSLSKELRAEKGEDKMNDGRKICSYSPCRAVSITKKIELDEQATFLFMKLKARLGKNLSDKDFLKFILEERERQEFPQTVAKRSGAAIHVNKEQKVKISNKKSFTGETFQEVIKIEKSEASDPLIAKSRYIPANKKREIIARTNGKCSYPNCNSPYEILHHVNRYSESKSHDCVTALCKIHHEFAHNNLIQNENMETNKWRISIVRPPDLKISRADILYRKYRREAMT